MSELAEAAKEAARSKDRAVSPDDEIRAEAEREVEAELATALKSGDPKRIRAAMRAVRELDD